MKRVLRPKLYRHKTVRLRNTAEPDTDIAKPDRLMTDIAELYHLIAGMKVYNKVVHK